MRVIINRVIVKSNGLLFQLSLWVPTATLSVVTATVPMVTGRDVRRRLWDPTASLSMVETSTPQPLMLPTLWPCSSLLSLECQERTIPSMLRSQSLASLAMVRLMEVTTLILRLSVKHSTSVLLMVLVVWLNTAFSAPMELSSTRTTSSVTGGSTLTVPRPRVCTASMTNTLLRETLCLELPVMPRLTTLPPPLLMLVTLLLLNIQVLKVLVLELDVRDLQAVETTGEDFKNISCGYPTIQQATNNNI